MPDVAEPEPKPTTIIVLSRDAPAIEINSLYIAPGARLVSMGVTEVGHIVSSGGMIVPHHMVALIYEGKA